MAETIMTILAGRQTSKLLDAAVNDEGGIKDLVDKHEGEIYDEGGIKDLVDKHEGEIYDEGGIKDLVDKHEDEIYTAQTGILARLTALENPN